MNKLQGRQLASQSGFTLMEIIVATAIFVTVVSSVLVLFDYVLKINRRVQGVRQVAQGSRNFTEVLAREIRNGRVDYTSSSSNCDYRNYATSENKSLAITTFNGAQVCLYLDPEAPGQLKVDRRDLTGTVTTESINPPNFTINPDSFRFIVRPTTYPDIAVPGSNKGVQPMVTILAEFKVFAGTNDEQVIPYQTTISSDVYDVPPF